MPKTFRILAILLLTFTTMAAAHQDAEQPKTSTHKAHKAKSAPKSTAPKTAAKRNRPADSRSAAKKKATPAQVRRMTRAFVASADLKVMARQLLENRTPAAYNGVESYARRHAGTDAGALAWLAMGDAHVLDQQYPQAILALEKAKPHAGELFDYVRYLEAISYGAEGNSARVIELLRTFDKDAPESIFLNDVVDVYGNALAAQGKSQEAIAYLEAHRVPVRASVELALGKSYLHSEHPEKGMEILKHLYFTMPSSAEAADAATTLTANGSALEGSYSDEMTRADLLAKAGRWTDAARAYRLLLDKAPITQLGAVQVALASVLRHTDAKEGRKLLEQVEPIGEANAQRLYLLGEIARNDNNESAVVQNLEHMRQAVPASNPTSPSPTTP